MSALRTVATRPFTEHQYLPQALHQPLSCFQQPHYLGNLVQSFMGLFGDRLGQTLVIGGDGQMITQDFLQIILKMAAANGFGKIIIGSQGLLSPVMISALIRQYQAIAGILISSQSLENDWDIHLDLYGQDGRIASQSLLAALQERSQIIQSYSLLDMPDLVLNRPQSLSLENFSVEVVNSATLYSKLLASVFDLDAIQDYWQTQLSPDSLGKPVTINCFDSVNYAYAQFILEKTLGFSAETVVYSNLTPVFDAVAGEINLPLSRPTITLAAALTHHRYGIFGHKQGVTASDSLAILTANAPLIPAYRGNLGAVTRSQLTSVAVDHVCLPLEINCYETPSQWEFLGDSLDEPGVAFVGNEKGEIGANYSRERDGLWAILFWLNICALRRESVETILQSHWLKYGRNYHARYTYENININFLHDFWYSLQSEDVGESHGGDLQVAYAQPLKYYYQKQFQWVEQWGYSLGLTDGSRVIFTLDTLSPRSERGNLHLYLETYEPSPEKQRSKTAIALAPLHHWTEELPCFQELTRAIAASQNAVKRSQSS